MALTYAEKLELVQLLQEKQRRKCVASLYEFVKAAWHVIEPGLPFIGGWHLKAICDHLQAVHEGQIRNLIINIPPRHAKSTIVSIAFAAWKWIHQPNYKFIYASHAFSLSKRDSIKCRILVTSDWYRETFRPKWLLSDDQNEKMKFNNTLGGSRRAASVGGSVIGEGSDCFPKGVYIGTLSGYKDISDIQPNDIVRSYNHETNKIEYKRVEAIRSKRVSGLVKITTFSGREVLCTPEHRIYTQDFGYRQATNINYDRILVESRILQNQKSDGYSQLCNVRKTARKNTLRIREIFAYWMQRSLLLNSMQKQTPQFQEYPQMCLMRQSSLFQWIKVLFQGMHTNQKKNNYKILSYLQKRIRSNSITCHNVFETVLGTSSFSKNERKEKFKLQTWKRILCHSFRSIVSFNQGTRYVSMFNLQNKRSTNSASYQSQKERRQTRESNHTLFFLPCQASFEFQTASDIVSSVTAISTGEIEVFDIQVEGNCNFFANGILVHNCLVIDDPHDPMEVYSDTTRQNVLDWYDQEFCSRVNDPKTVSRILIMQRLHEGDLTQHLIDKGNWEHLCLPAEYDGSNRSKTSLNWSDPRIELGEPLWPERFGKTEIDTMKNDMGAVTASGQLQQNPTPAGGALFKPEMFEKVTLPAKFDWSFVTADTAYKEKQQNDFTCFVAFGVLAGRLYVRGVWMTRIKASDIEKPAEAFIRSYMGYGYRATLIEPKGHGIYLNQVFSGKHLMIPSEKDLTEFYSDRHLNKVERANNAVPHLSNRKVYFNQEMPDIDIYIQQCLTFPNGRNDDFCDALIDGVKRAYSHKPSILDLL